jgi:hypothetical protein
MGLLAGAASVTRFNVTVLSGEPDFNQIPFREITPGSEVRQRAGFLPFEPDAPYRIGHDRFAFRVRIDNVRPDPTAVRERLRDLLKTERETTGKPAGASTRKKLRHLAEEELLTRTAPRSRVVECCLAGKLLWVGSTGSGAIGTVLTLLRAIGVVVEPKTPWLDRGEKPVDSDIVRTPGREQSILGCRFLKALLGDSEIMLEPESGSVSLQTADIRVSLRGAVLLDLQRYLKADAEILHAKLVVGESAFRFDALSFRVAGLRLRVERFETWVEQLDARMERIAALFELLDARYASLSAKLHADQS